MLRAGGKRGGGGGAAARPRRWRPPTPHHPPRPRHCPPPVTAGAMAAAETDARVCVGCLAVDFSPPRPRPVCPSAALARPLWGGCPSRCWPSPPWRRHPPPPLPSHSLLRCAAPRRGGRADRGAPRRASVPRRVKEKQSPCGLGWGRGWRRGTGGAVYLNAWRMAATASAVAAVPPPPRKRPAPYSAGNKAPRLLFPPPHGSILQRRVGRAGADVTSARTPPTRPSCYGSRRTARGPTPTAGARPYILAERALGSGSPASGEGSPPSRPGTLEPFGTACRST